MYKNKKIDFYKLHRKILNPEPITMVEELKSGEGKFKGKRFSSKLYNYIYATTTDAKKKMYAEELKEAFDRIVYQLVEDNKIVDVEMRIIELNAKGKGYVAEKGFVSEIGYYRDNKFILHNDYGPARKLHFNSEGYDGYYDDEYLEKEFLDKEYFFKEEYFLFGQPVSFEYHSLHCRNTKFLLRSNGFHEGMMH